MSERREREVKVETTKPISALEPVNEARLLMPDIDRLQDAQYEMLSPEASEYARLMDAQYPLWSICHSNRPPATQRGWAAQTPAGQAAADGWRTNWSNVANLYIYHSLTHDDIARFSNIAIRSIAGHSGRYGWVQAKRTYRLMRESENTPDLKDLEEQVRKDKIGEFLTQAGLEVGRHAMQALLQNVDKIEPRDVPGLLMAATKILSMGTKMPESYRYSQVDNPNSNQRLPQVNILNISGEKAEEMLASLRARADVLDAAALPPPDDTK